MKSEHLKPELEFYNNAFKDNKNRRKKVISWEYSPSKIIINLLKSNDLIYPKNKRMLDLGCGDGRHISFFRKKDFDVVGVDFSEEAIKLCKNRFKGDSRVCLERIDLTEQDSILHLGKFDLVLDWSVLDHIRRQYLPEYLHNIMGSIKEGGYLIASEFDISVRNLYKGKDYKCRGGHYSRGFSLGGLIELLNPSLVLLDSREKVLEDSIAGYKFNTVLMKKRENYL